MRVSLWFRQDKSLLNSVYNIVSHPLKRENGKLEISTGVPSDEQFTETRVVS